MSMMSLFSFFKLFRYSIVLMLDRFTNVKGLGLFLSYHPSHICPHVSQSSQSSKERECQLACPFAVAVSREAHNTFYASSRGFWPIIPVLCRLYVLRIFGYSLRFLNLFSILFRSTYSSPTLSSHFVFGIWLQSFLPSSSLSPPRFSYFIELLLRYHQPVSQSVSHYLALVSFACFHTFPAPALALHEYFV